MQKYVVSTKTNNYLCHTIHMEDMEQPRMEYRRLSHWPTNSNILRIRQQQKNRYIWKGWEIWNASLWLRMEWQM